MMWLVQVALRRPLTVAVMAMLMMVIGVMSFFQMNVDIFPAINLPVVMVVWNYPGLAAFQMERQMVWISERAYSTTVNDIDHIESESINGLGILRVYFHPGADLGSAIAQINAVSETILTILPRGTQPPQIISYDASNLPVAQLNLSSEELSEQQLFDYGLNFVRIQLFTIPGFSTPAPLGGVQRAVMVNLDPLRLYAVGMSPQDVGQALASTNIIIPSGTAKMGNYEYVVDLNMSPESVSSFNKLPVKVVGETPVRLGDIAPVSDTHQPQTNVVRVNGRRGSFLMVIKHANASTLSVVKAVRQRLPLLRANLPPSAEESAVLVNLRSVGIRPRRALGSRSGVGCCRDPGFPHGAGVSWLGAQHADRDRVHSAVDPDRDYWAASLRPDDQYHDSGRNCPRRGNAGR